MKKIINGKVYNTETAKAIGTYDNEGGWGDLQHFEETLYQKRTGEYFLYGEGGAMTRYSKQVGSNNWGCGNAITTMTIEDARNWAEEHLSAEKYEEAFGEIVEDSTKKIVAVNLTTDAVEKAKRKAAEQGTTLSAVVDSFVKTYAG